jgi:hypothetical protein
MIPPAPRPAPMWQRAALRTKTAVWLCLHPSRRTRVGNLDELDRATWPDGPYSNPLTCRLAPLAPRRLALLAILRRQS